MARVPVVCYCGWLLITALANRHLQSIVTRPPVLDARIGAERVAMIRLRGNAVILGAATATLVGIVVPILGQMMLATMPLWRLALRRLNNIPREAAG
ncbi:hypothetical protein FHS31_000963 [Sphingomonas vulcanisoli]|uniref:Uncharacterized protein n=1 Tax=Sphingomonas vulcanisoli TaxID=1658060 RepID=A0ABX0TPE3_9SPHN|nr:hypothetical protein [Sphingomonas vulcanisoli]NIJ07367.1 hypothetical protein [Sphingomonas vulcanisoli]